MLYQSPAGFQQTLLQAGQRPIADPFGQRQPPLQVAKIVGENTQPQLHLIGAETVAAKPHHRCRLLSHDHDSVLTVTPIGPAWVQLGLGAATSPVSNGFPISSLPTLTDVSAETTPRRILRTAGQKGYRVRSPW